MVKRILGLMIAVSACTSAPPTPAPKQQPAAQLPAQPSKMAASTAESPAPIAAPPPAPPPEPPAYDLNADQQLRIKTAKEELGSKAVTAIVSDVFVTVGPPGWQGPQFDQSVGLMRNAMAGFMNKRFTSKPQRAITVFLFPNAQSYEQFCTKKYHAPCIAHFGFYHPADRYMVMNIGLGLGTLTHELVHPLVEADFPNAPTWINEGIASVFEQPLLPKTGEIHGGKNWRYPRLRRAMTSNTEKGKARLDRLFGMRDETFRGDDEDLHYALSRYVCQWMDERGYLWSFFQKWRENSATDPTGEKSFKEVTGMTPTDAHDVWQKWALAL